MLKNHNRTIPDLSGYWVEIGYGDTYLGTNYYAQTSRMWVIKQQLVSVVGRLYTILQLHGLWNALDQQQLLLGTAPLYQDPTGWWETQTVRELLNAACNHLLVRSDLTNTTALTGIGSCGNNAIGLTLDGIINTYRPRMDINQHTLDSVLAVLWRLIQMTKCVLRVKASNVIDIIYPQDTDSIDRTFYNYQQPYFYEFTDIDNVTTPNQVLIFGLIDPDLGWIDDNGVPLTYNIISGMAWADTTQIGKYMSVTEIYKEPNLNTISDLTDRAEVIMERIKFRDVTGQLTVPHDAALELYDFIQINDTRGY